MDHRIPLHSFAIRFLARAGDRKETTAERMIPEPRPPRTFLLLAPDLRLVPNGFSHRTVDPDRYARVLADLQRFRGRMYLMDGAVEAWQLTPDGRHCQSTDGPSWHILALERDQVMGCARLHVVPPETPYSRLSVARSAQGHSLWGGALQRAVTADLNRAQAGNLVFVEAGGWALAPELRFTTEALRIALGSYALGQLMGGGVGLATATVRHNSSSILRRLGGTPFVHEGQSLPAYYEPAYGCEMEIIRFDTNGVSAKYSKWLSEIRQEMVKSHVLCASDMSTSSAISSLANAINVHHAQQRSISEVVSKAD